MTVSYTYKIHFFGGESDAIYKKACLRAFRLGIRDAFLGLSALGASSVPLFPLVAGTVLAATAAAGPFALAAIITAIGLLAIGLATWRCIKLFLIIKAIEGKDIATLKGKLHEKIGNTSPIEMILSRSDALEFLEAFEQEGIPFNIEPKHLSCILSSGAPDVFQTLQKAAARDLTMIDLNRADHLPADVIQYLYKKRLDTLRKQHPEFVLENDENFTRQLKASPNFLKLCIKSKQLGKLCDPQSLLSFNLSFDQSEKATVCRLLRASGSDGKAFLNTVLAMPTPPEGFFTKLEMAVFLGDEEKIRALVEEDPLTLENYENLILINSQCRALLESLLSPRDCFLLSFSCELTTIPNTEHRPQGLKVNPNVNQSGLYWYGRFCSHATKSSVKPRFYAFSKIAGHSNIAPICFTMLERIDAYFSTQTVSAESIATIIELLNDGADGCWARSLGATRQAHCLIPHDETKYTPDSTAAIDQALLGCLFDSSRPYYERQEVLKNAQNKTPAENWKALSFSPKDRILRWMHDLRIEIANEALGGAQGINVHAQLSSLQGLGAKYGFYDEAAAAHEGNTQVPEFLSQAFEKCYTKERLLKALRACCTFYNIETQDLLHIIAAKDADKDRYERELTQRWNEARDIDLSAANITMVLARRDLYADKDLIQAALKKPSEERIDFLCERTMDGAVITSHDVYTSLDKRDIEYLCLWALGLLTATANPLERLKGEMNAPRTV